MKSNWVPALRVFGQISTWIVIPIVISLVAGKKLDRYFDTEPILFLSLAFLGFLVSCFGIWKVMKVYIEEIKKTGNK